MLNSKVLSASVLAALMPAVASAADAPKNDSAPKSPPKKSSENPLEVSVTGGLVFSDFTQSIGLVPPSYVDGGIEYQPLDDIPFLNPEQGIGGYGSISIGRKIENSDYDWKISAAVTSFMDGNSSYSLFPVYDIHSASTLGFQTIDFDIGRRFNADSVNGRVSLGVRGLHMKDSANVGVGVFGFGADLNSSHEFLGAGPRLGLDLQSKGMIGLKSSVGVAMLYGNSNTKSSYTYNYGFGNYDFPIGEKSGYDWITDVEGSLGVVVNASDSTSFEAGYRGEKLFGVNNSQQEDVLSHGPYIRFDMKF